MRAVQMTEYGGPEVLQLTELPDPEPGDGQVLVDVTSAGVNYADTHQTENDYLTPTPLPFVPGSEVVGTTPDGRRVTGMCGTGGYAEKALVAEQMLVPVPDGVGDPEAVAMLVQGLTAWHLAETSTRIGAGDVVVVHAATGGVGSLLVQLARRRGAATIVGTASSAGKRELAMELGCDATIDSTTDDMKGAIEDACSGKPDVIIDMVGGTTTDQSFAALAPLGRYAYYGAASRQTPSPITFSQLMNRSKTVSGFWLVDCMSHPETMVGPPLQELFGLIVAGDLRVVGGSRYALADAAQAHVDMRERRTTGKVTLDCTA